VISKNLSPYETWIKSTLTAAAWMQAESQCDINDLIIGFISVLSYPRLYPQIWVEEKEGWSEIGEEGLVCVCV
jgi:hypothetical protein